MWAHMMAIHGQDSPFAACEVTGPRDQCTQTPTGTLPCSACHPPISAVPWQGAFLLLHI